MCLVQEFESALWFATAEPSSLCGKNKVHYSGDQGLQNSRFSPSLVPGMSVSYPILLQTNQLGLLRVQKSKLGYSDVKT
jgi:hypothetical protein